MSIRKRKWGDGNEGFEASTSYRGRRKRKLFKSKAEAKAWLHEQELKKRAGTYLAETSKVTMESLLPQYTQFVEARHRAGELGEESAARLVSMFKNYVLGGYPIHRPTGTVVFENGLGEHKLSDIDQFTVRDFIRDLRAFGLSIKTTKEVKFALSSFFEFARQKRFVVANPTTGVFVTRRGSTPRKKVRVPPKLLLLRMISNATDAFAVMIKMAAFVGIRQGEHRAAMWGDVDFMNNTLSVTKALTQRNRLKGPKSEAGVRVIPLPATLVAELKELRCSAKYSADTDPIFANGKGKPIDPTTILKQWKRLYEQAIQDWPSDEAIPPKPRWHDLRHFCASLWLELGMQPKLAQKFIGHETLDFTMRVYAHVFEAAGFNGEMDKIPSGLLAPPEKPSDT